MIQVSLFPTRSETIETEQQFFQKKLRDDGTATCPCCNRDAMVSKLRIHATLAYMLCRLYRASTEKYGDATGWIHLGSIKTAALSGNDFSIVKHWEVAEPMPAGHLEDKRSSGMWRLTELGESWIKRKCTIQKNIYVFDNRVIKYSDEQMTIDDALNKKFSYFDSTGIGGISDNY